MLLIKRKRKRHCTSVLRFHPGSSYQADASRKNHKTVTEHPFPCVRRENELLVGEVSLALFNYESRQEAWKIPARPGAKGWRRREAGAWFLKNSLSDVKDAGWRVREARLTLGDESAGAGWGLGAPGAISGVLTKEVWGRPFVQGLDLLATGR